MNSSVWAADAQKAPVKEVAGEVVSVDGVVFIRADDSSTANLRPARPGDKVMSGDVINTSSNGKIKILLQDKSIIDLGPSALFKMDRFANNEGNNREVDINMLYGTMRTAVTKKIEGKGRFHVRTPTATMGVRGTEFVVKSEVKSLTELSQAFKPNTAQPGSSGSTPASTGGEKSKTEITVLQGEVAVAPKDNGKSKTGLGVNNAPLPSSAVSLTSGMQLSTKEGDAQMAKPVALDQKQLASVTSTAKVIDNTFTKAVIIDVPNNNNGTSQNNGGGPSREPAGAGSTSANGSTAPVTTSAAATGVGSSTLDAIKTTVSETPPPALPPVTFNHPVDVFNPIPVNTQAGLKKLRVIVIAP